MAGQESAHGGNSTLTGVLCGMGAGALWGLVFLAPELIPMFNPLELTIGRYLAYGLISAALIIPRWHRLRSKIRRREWTALAWLALAGNTVYYLLLSGAVQAGGIALTSLVIGFLPVAVTIIGSRDRNAVPLRRLYPSLMLCAAGAVCIGWQALAAPASTSLLGLLCAIGALISWTTYGVGNSRWLARIDDVSSHDWNLLIGIATGAQSLMLIPVVFLLGAASHSGDEWMRFLSISVGIAVFSSIVGSVLWNRMSRLLPLTMVGQMILFETLFALIYGFMWEQRLPTILEAAAFAFAVLSVISCISAHRKPDTGLAENTTAPCPA